MRNGSIRAIRLLALAGTLLGGTLLCATPGCQSGCCAPRPGPDTLMLAPDNAAGAVGTLRRADLLVAFHRSARHDEVIRSLMHRRDQAQEAGDDATVAALESYGGMMQDIAHRQLAGKEPLYTVLLGVQDELGTVMANHGLGRVVEAGPGVQGLDITDELIALIPEAERHQR